MNWDVFITCAVTGVGDTVARSDRVPVTPEQIADSAIEAAEAGAAVVHIHGARPGDGRRLARPILYREVVERIRASGTDTVINLTAGMGGDLVLGGDEAPVPFDATEPTSRAQPSGSRTSRSCCRRSARSTAAR